MNIVNGYSYDDILIQPKYSEIDSRNDVALASYITKNIKMKLPLISSNMDTITEDKMAITMALNGGIGIIHRFCSIEDQVRMVKRVKRHVNYKILNPYVINENSKLYDLNKLIASYKIYSYLVVNNENKLSGIVTKRDMNFITNQNLQIKDIMTKDNLITGTGLTTCDDAMHLMKKNKIEKLPLINEKREIVGLFTTKDIIYYKEGMVNSNVDKECRLRCGAAIGINQDYLDRAKELINAGVDILVIDVAHGHTKQCKNAIMNIKKLINDRQIDIIAGNVCTAEGTKFLIDAGADGIKVNIGAGSICTTRIVSGCGVPQFSAVLNCALEAKKHGIPVISDGGHCGSIGNIFKGLAAGASSAMLGNFLSGTDETPGKILVKDGKKVKMVRGMAGYFSNLSKFDKLGDNKDISTMCPEGVEGYVPYKGDVESILKQIKKGICSGMSYVGCRSISELHTENISFVKITQTGRKESGSHSINAI